MFCFVCGVMSLAPRGRDAKMRTRTLSNHIVILVQVGGDRGDSNLDPTIDPPAMYDMYEQWHHPDWSQAYPDGVGF